MTREIEIAGWRLALLAFLSMLGIWKAIEIVLALGRIPWPATISLIGA